MILFICLIFICSQQTFSQSDSSINIDFHSSPNIKKFADYLFCTDDYLRAVLEYEKYLTSNFNDTVEFKIGLAYLRIGDYIKASNWFENIKNKSGFFSESKKEYFRSLFQEGNYYNFRKIYLNKMKKDEAPKLFYFSYFFTDDELPSKNNFFSPFNLEEKKIVDDFYERKINPPNKSVTAAVLMSTLIPGLGKIYAGQIGDGVVAAIATGLFGFLAYDNFKAEHDFRGWLFSGITAFFYAGNIYGSAAAAQIYNAGIKFNFENDVKFYLNEQNYFTPKYDFCK
jgi:TM2 domain-containing membrane protein YozV